MTDLDEVTTLYRVTKTVYQMLKDRGYIISEKKFNQTKEAFTESYNKIKSSLNILVEKRPIEGEDYQGESQKLLVFFPEIEKLNVKALEEICLKMIEITCYNSIIVVKGNTQIAKKVRSFV